MAPLTIEAVSIERPLKVALTVVLILIFIGYAGYQARNLIKGPSITLTHEPSTTQSERGLTLIGTARNVVILRLNGKEIHTDESGFFEHTVTLENGYTILTLEAEDRYGRRTDLTRAFIYKPNS